MISVPEALDSAVRFSAQIFGKEVAQSARLEEVDLGQRDGMATWEITLSFILPESPSISTGLLPFVATKRTYKSFTILKETGEVLSMKIRELAGA